MNKKNVMIIVGIIAFILIIGGISYSYFVYNKDVGNVSLDTGEISIDFSNTNGNKTLTNVIPLSDNDGKTSSDYFDFTVNATVDTEKIYYEVYILPKSGNTLDTSYLKTYLTDQSNNEIKGVKLYSSLSTSEKENDGKILYKGLIELNNNHTSKTESKDFRLRMWLDENYTEQTSKTFEFDIYLYAKNVPIDFEIDGASMVRKAIIAKEADTNVQCSNITYEEDGITYFSGTNDCVDMNYVWYSGKLWRITAIYPDGAMKLVTQNNITSIAFNASEQVNFYTDANTTSYMYQWLNEDFYDTLYNANNVIDTSKQWNATMPSDTTISTKPLETNMVTANVGLLNNYEYYNSYRCVGSSTCTGTSCSTGYLNIGYYWWLLNPYDTSKVLYVYNLGYGNNHNPINTSGSRPSIYLKSGLEFTGNGTKQSPYKIVGDKATGTANELINTRLSGEYVKLKNGNDEQIFRIIGVEDNQTKIIAIDYADNNAEKPFSTTNATSGDNIWGSTATSGSGTWYTYLNNTYFPNLTSKYGNLFGSGTYYMGGTTTNYKLAICANTTSGNIKICDKTNNKGTFNIGLPRYGEMFSSQKISSTLTHLDAWLITPYPPGVSVWYNTANDAAAHPAPTIEHAACPTVHLKSTVKILSGSGTENDPYVVGL